MFKKSLKPDFPLISLVAVNLIIISFCAYFGDPPNEHFKEEKFATWVSFGQLLICSLFALQIFWVRRKYLTSGSFWIWALMSTGFMYLAADEIFKAHENIDLMIHKMLNIRETGISDRLDDIIVAGYGFLGIGLLWYFRDEMTYFKSSASMFKVGFAFLFLMVILDLFGNRNDILPMFISSEKKSLTIRAWLGVIEDSNKLLAEVMFIGALFECSKTAGQLRRITV